MVLRGEDGAMVVIRERESIDGIQFERRFRIARWYLLLILLLVGWKDSVRVLYGLPMMNTR